MFFFSGSRGSIEYTVINDANKISVHFGAEGDGENREDEEIKNDDAVYKNTPYPKKKKSIH